MMLACSPPFVMMPCMRASGRICWRIASSALKRPMTAFSALTPRHGHDEAWAGWPKNSASTFMRPSGGRPLCAPPRPWVALPAQPPGHPLDVGAVLGQELGEPRDGLLFLERELGRGVDAMREALQLVGEAVDGVGDLQLHVAGGVAHFFASNSARARLTRPGSASRSSVVIAIVLAAWHMPCRARGETAAASNAREWIGVPVGAICTIGWMAGITWLTLPMSDEPSRSGAGDSSRPTVFMLARK